MVATKYLLGILVLMFAVGISFGFNYATTCVDNSPNLLIWGSWQNSDNIVIKVIDANGNVIQEVNPTTVSDFENSKASGVYYSEVSLPSADTYIIEVDKGSTSDAKMVKVPCVESNVTPSILTIARGNTSTKVYVNIFGDNISQNVTGTVKLYYRNGHLEKSVTVSNGSNIYSFDIKNSDFGNVAVVVLEFNGKYTYKVFEQHESDQGNVQVYAQPLPIRRGQTVNYDFEIENMKNYQFTYTLTYDSNLIVMGPSQITLGPHEKQNVEVTVTAPRNFSEIPYFNIVVDNESFSVETKILPAMGFNVESNLPDTVLKGSVVRGTLDVENVGDTPVKVNFYYKVNDDTYNYPYEITLKPYESFSFPINFLAEDDSNVVAYINGEEVYSTTIQVNPIIKQFSAYLINDSLSGMKGDVLTTKLVIQNTGNVEYRLKIIPESNSLTFNTTEVDLKPNDISEINVSVLANELGNHNLRFKVCDDSCSEYKISLFVDMPVNERTVVSMSNNTKFEPNKTLNYTIEIKNVYPLGSQTYTLLVNGSTYDIFVLKPNESKAIVVPFNFTNNTNYTVSFVLYNGGNEIYNKSVVFTPVEQKVVPTGEFYLKVGSVSWWALITLAVVGVGFLGYTVYTNFKKKVQVEKNVISNDYR